MGPQVRERTPKIKNFLFIRRSPKEIRKTQQSLVDGVGNVNRTGCVFRTREELPQIRQVNRKMSNEYELSFHRVTKCKKKRKEKKTLSQMVIGRIQMKTTHFDFNTDLFCRWPSWGDVG